MRKEIIDMSYNKVYSCLVNKAIKKNRTKEEVDDIIIWLTGYNKNVLYSFSDDYSYGSFFENAPKMNEKRFMIHGSICNIKIDSIENPLIKDIRILDKLIDDLAKGKSLDKVLNLG